MYIIKIIIFSLIILVSSYIGITIAKKYSLREKELKGIKNALNMFRTKIRYTYNTIPEIFKEIETNTVRRS